MNTSSPSFATTKKVILSCIGTDNWQLVTAFLRPYDPLVIVCPELRCNAVLQSSQKEPPAKGYNSCLRSVASQSQNVNAAWKWLSGWYSNATELTDVFSTRLSSSLVKPVKPHITESIHAAWWGWSQFRKSSFLFTTGRIRLQTSPPPEAEVTGGVSGFLPLLHPRRIKELDIRIFVLGIKVNVS